MVSVSTTINTNTTTNNTDSFEQQGLQTNSSVANKKAGFALDL